MNDLFADLKKKRRLLLEEAEANNEKLLVFELILGRLGQQEDHKRFGQQQAKQHCIERKEDRNGGHDHESGTERRASFLEEGKNAADVDGGDHDHLRPLLASLRRLRRACGSDASNGDNDIRLLQSNKCCAVTTAHFADCMRKDVAFSTIPA